MKYGLSNTLSKERVEKIVKNLCRSRLPSSFNMPLISILADRAWIMSFATACPWLPLEEDEYALFTGLARTVSPAMTARLATATSCRFLDAGMMGLDPIERLATTGYLETKNSFDARYIAAVRSVIKYLLSDILQADLSYMWAVGKARFNFAYLDVLHGSISDDIYNNLGLTRPQDKLEHLFDKWLSVEQALLEKYTTVGPRSNEALAVANAVDKLRDALSTVLIVLTFAPHDHKSLCLISALKQGEVNINLRTEALSELRAVYPQVYSMSLFKIPSNVDQSLGFDSSLADKEVAWPAKANIFSPTNSKIVKIVDKNGNVHGYTCERQLSVGVQGRNRRYSQMAELNEMAYPLLVMAALAEPGCSAFFAERVDGITNHAIWMDDVEAVTPYYSAEDKRLLTWKEALKLPRVLMSKNNGRIVQTVNPSVPATVGVSSIADTLKSQNGRTFTTGISIMSGASGSKPDIIVFKHSRHLLPDIMENYRNHGRLKNADCDPVIKDIGPDNKVFSAFDFIIDTPDMADADPVYHALSFEKTEGDTSTKYPIPVMKIRVSTKAGVTRLTYIFRGTK